MVTISWLAGKFRKVLPLNFEPHFHIVKNEKKINKRKTVLICVQSIKERFLKPAATEYRHSPLQQ